MRYFLTLARTGSVTRAAEIHRISPAAFSKAMKVFEGEVGKQLILSHGRGVILSDYARALVPSLDAIIRQIDNIRNRSDEKSQTLPALRVATFEVFSTHFMAKAIKNYFEEYACEILEMAPGKMEEAVATGKADLALTYLPIPHPDLDFLKVHEIAMGIYGAKTFSEAKGFSELPFVVPVTPVEGSPNKVRGLDGWPDDALPRNIKYQVEMLETALGLCREGLSVAYLPKFIVGLHNQTVKASLHLEELPKPKSLQKRHDYVYLVKRKSDHEGVTAKKMARAVRMICG